MQPRQMHQAHPMHSTHFAVNMRAMTPREQSSGHTVQSGGGYSVGDRVVHSRFGIGVVQQMEGMGDSLKITVDFQNAGTKKLLVKFAQLKKL